jgi:tetratricopeptide (TPR) repeat protein
MFAKYYNANCQRNHWKKHKKECKLRAAELHDEALFKDPPAKEDCPICFLPMPFKLIACMTLPPATISSVPIHDYAVANEELVNKGTEQYYSCCGKSICGGCMHSFQKSGNAENCPYCKADRVNKTDEEAVEELMKRVEVNDADAMYVLGSYHSHGQLGLQQDRGKALELWKQAAALGSSHAHFHLGNEYRQGGDLKKAKIHYKAAAMAGHEDARYNLGTMEAQSGNMGQAVKHWTIAASGGHYKAMKNMLVAFNQGLTSRATIDATLTEYNNSCAEMRSEARDAYIRVHSDHAGER